MRLLHTADWHLGRSFYSTSLIEDQVFILDQFVDLVKTSAPDVVLIAGDVYDRAIPSTAAVELLDDVLSRLIIGLKIPVILVAGNHDSPQRLQFGARLMESMRLYVYGTISDRSNFIQMYDDAGSVCFYVIPYTEPSIVREWLKSDRITSHASAMQAWTDLLRTQHSKESRSVIVTHAFVVGGEESESERPLSVGGSGAVDASSFDGFDFVALGHLHRFQSLDGTRIHYSGSPLKYTFSEAGHAKSVSLVEMDEKGRCRIEPISLRPKHDVRCVEGQMDELLKQTSSADRDDYIQIKLLDRGAILDPMGRLREVYPNVMDLDRSSWFGEPGQIQFPDRRETDVVTLFEDFYGQVMAEPLTEAERSAFTSVLTKLERTEREANS